MERHPHEHNHSRAGEKLKFALILTGIILVGELLGGYFANSLALLSDAGHVFTDILALTLSWFAVRQAERPPTAKMTYGFHRVGILIAIVNAVTVAIISLVIFYEAYQRLQRPAEVESILMLSVATIGLVVNLVVVFTLRKEQESSLNVRSALLHVFGDALASIGVVVGGVIIYFTGLLWVDPVASIFIGLIILFGAWQIVREGVSIILEATPAHLNVEEVVKAMTAVEGVNDVHDLHVWTIAPRLHALSCHVLIDDMHISEGAQILERLRRLLGERFDIGHSTFQFECESCGATAACCFLLPTEQRNEKTSSAANR